MPRRTQRDKSRDGQKLPGAAGQGSAEEHRNGCRGKVREGKRWKWRRVTSLSVNLMKLCPTYGAKADAACSSVASLTPWGVMALLWTSYVLTLLPGHLPPSLEVGSSLVCVPVSSSYCGTATGKLGTSAAASLPFLFLSICQHWELSKQVYAWVQKLRLARTMWFLGL